MCCIYQDTLPSLEREKEIPLKKRSLQENYIVYNTLETVLYILIVTRVHR